MKKTYAIRVTAKLYKYIRNRIERRYGNVSVPYGIYLTFKEAENKR